MTVLSKIYAAPPVSRREMLRYMRCESLTPEVEALLDECLAEALPALHYRICYARVAIERMESGLLVGTLRTTSADLEKNLTGCDEALVFAATVGHALDRMIARYGHTSPARALCLQAIGTERVEALCDAFCAEMTDALAKEDKHLRPRFSPGYGDLPLCTQRDVFALLEPQKHLGLTLTENILMSPTKSVTALAGIEVEP